MRESERGFYVLAVLIGVYLDGAVVPAHNELSHPIARDVEVVQTLDRPVLPLAFHRPLHLWALPNETHLHSQKGFGRVACSCAVHATISRLFII